MSSLVDQGGHSAGCHPVPPSPSHTYTHTILILIPYRYSYSYSTPTILNTSVQSMAWSLVLLIPYHTYTYTYTHTILNIFLQHLPCYAIQLSSYSCIHAPHLAVPNFTIKAWNGTQRPPVQLHKSEFQPNFGTIGSTKISTGSTKVSRNWCFLPGASAGGLMRDQLHQCVDAPSYSSSCATMHS